MGVLDVLGVIEVWRGVGGEEYQLDGLGPPAGGLDRLVEGLVQGLGGNTRPLRPLVPFPDRFTRI